MTENDFRRLNSEMQQQCSQRKGKLEMNDYEFQRV